MGDQGGMDPIFGLSEQTREQLEAFRLRFGESHMAAVTEAAAAIRGIGMEARMAEMAKTIVGSGFAEKAAEINRLILARHGGPGIAAATAQMYSGDLVRRSLAALGASFAADMREQFAPLKPLMEGFRQMWADARSRPGTRPTARRRSPSTATSQRTG